MTTAHLIYGYLGAGKTTLARRLERELLAIRFTQDEWMSRLYGDDPPEERFADCSARVSGLIDSLYGPDVSNSASTSCWISDSGAVDSMTGHAGAWPASEHR